MKPCCSRWQRAPSAFVSTILPFCFLMAFGVSSIAAEPDWSRVPGPSAVPSQAIGSYALGCLDGATRLAEDDPGYQVMRPSRARYFGHPELIDFVQWLANQALARGRSGILVGDLAQARGGPMASGHASHQNGLDVDIWYLPAPARPLSLHEREALSAVSMISSDGLTTTGQWTADQVELLRAAALNPKVERIFVNAAIKKELCQTVLFDRGWLAKIRPWWGHDHHFHVRLACPKSNLNCSSQMPPPASEECDKGLAWWFSNDAKQALEEQKKQPRKVITMSDLPQECAAVYSRASAPDAGSDASAQSYLARKAPE